MRKGLSLVVLAGCVAALLAACGSSSNSARLRVFHGSADAPAVDILVDGRALISGLAFLEAAGYADVSDGLRRVQVNAAGTDTSVIDAELDLSEGAFYTVLASGLLESIGAIVLLDDRTPPDAGNIRVRVVHNAAGAPAVDVYVTELGADLESVTPVPFRSPFWGSVRLPGSSSRRLSAASDGCWDDYSSSQAKAQ